MTSGTSQGLFVVVAIVIFGIFVVLANTVFGSEGLTGDLQNLFTESTEQSLNTLGGGSNLVNIRRLKSFEPYHTEPKLKGNSFSVTRTGFRSYLAIAIEHGNKMPEKGVQYTVSGYMYINGEPATYEDWGSKMATTYSEKGTFYVDDETGYFESTQIRNSKTHMNYVLHTYIGTQNKGEVITVKDLKMVETD